MTFIDRVLAYIRNHDDQARTWAPTDLVLPLKCLPSAAGDAMRKLVLRGDLVRPEHGEYRLPNHEERTELRRPAPVVAAIPAPIPVQALPVTEAERIIMIRTLRAQGRPMAPALIAGRLGKCDIRLARTDELLALLAQENAVRQLPDGRWELVA